MLRAKYFSLFTYQELIVTGNNICETAISITPNAPYPSNQLNKFH